MKKTILTVGLLCALLNACSFRPIIDSNGRSGTFNNSTAENITNDIILCQELAKKNTNHLVESYKVVHNWYIRPQTLWLMPKAEYTNKKLVKNCLLNRGHSVIN
tara:strand:- start:32 stop:343 length:312 start_codon:yes stop_codon:yes gene_type:complete